MSTSFEALVDTKHIYTIELCQGGSTNAMQNPRMSNVYLPSSTTNSPMGSKQVTRSTSKLYKGCFLDKSRFTMSFADGQVRVYHMRYGRSAESFGGDSVIVWGYMNSRFRSLLKELP